MVFLACVVLVLVWAASGPFFGFSETWQLVHQHWDDHRDLSDGLFPSRTHRIAMAPPFKPSWTS